MKKIGISVNDNYILPDNIKKITAAEWEIILNYISELILKHDSVTLSNLKDDIKTETTEKYESIVTNLNKKLAITHEEILNLRNKIILLTEKEQEEITKQTQLLNKQFEQRLDRELSVLKEFHEKELAYKNTMLSNLESSTESRLSEKFLREISSLKKELESCEKKRELIYNSFNSEKNSLEEQYKQKIKQLELDAKSNLEAYLEQHNNSFENEKKLLARQIELSENNVRNISKELEQKNKILSELETRTEQRLLEQFENEKKSLLRELELKDLAVKKAEEHYNDQLQQLREETRVHDLLTKLDEKLNPVVNFYTGSNEEKGNAGEERILNMLQADQYEEAIMTNTSKDDHLGDIRFDWKNIKALIEIKNKKVITKKDMEKFLDNINFSLKTANPVNCGIFISLQTNTFPGRNKEPLQLDYVNNIPVIYLYIKGCDKSLLHCALLLLQKIIVTSGATTSQEEVLLEHFKNYYNFMITTKTIFEDQIITKKRELKKLCTQLESMDKKFSDLDIDYNKIVQVQNTTEEESPDKKEVKNNSAVTPQLFKATYIKIASESKNAAEAKSQTNATAMGNKLNINAKQITTLGGYSKLREEAKKEFLHSLLNKESVDKINQYIKTYGRHPDRDYLIAKQNKLFTDLQLRKLGFVVQNKKLAEFICNYCDELSKKENVIYAEQIVENNVEERANNLLTNDNNVDEDPVSNAEENSTSEQEDEQEDEQEESSDEVEE